MGNFADLDRLYLCAQRDSKGYLERAGWPIPPDFLSGLGGVGELHAAFLGVVTGVADPRGDETTLLGDLSQRRSRVRFLGSVSFQKAAQAAIDGTAQ
jgi:hypothetical protein